MAQVLWMAAVEKQSAYDPDHASGAPLEGFLDHVMNTAILNWMEARETEKRGGDATILSLDNEVQAEDGDDVTPGDAVSEEAIPSKRPALSDAEFMLDLNRAFPALSAQQRKIGRLLINGFSPSEIATYLKKPRTTIQDELNRIAVLLFQSGLKDYLPESWILPAWVLRSVKRRAFPVLHKRDHL